MFKPRVPAKIHGVRHYIVASGDMRRKSVTPKENQYGLRFDFGDYLERSTSLYI